MANVASWKLDPISKIQAQRSRIQGPRRKVQDQGPKSKTKIQHRRPKIQHPRSMIQEQSLCLCPGLLPLCICICSCVALLCVLDRLAMACLLLPLMRFCHAMPCRCVALLRSTVALQAHSPTRNGLHTGPLRIICFPTNIKACSSSLTATGVSDILSSGELSGLRTRAACL